MHRSIIAVNVTQCVGAFLRLNFKTVERQWKLTQALLNFATVNGTEETDLVLSDKYMYAPYRQSYHCGIDHRLRNNDNTTNTTTTVIFNGLQVSVLKYFVCYLWCLVGAIFDLWTTTEVLIFRNCILVPLHYFCLNCVLYYPSSLFVRLGMAPCICSICIHMHYLS